MELPPNIGFGQAGPGAARKGGVNHLSTSPTGPLTSSVQNQSTLLPWTPQGKHAPTVPAQSDRFNARTRIADATPRGALALEALRRDDDTFQTLYSASAFHPALGMLALSCVDASGAGLAEENKSVVEQIFALQMANGGFESEVGSGVGSESITTLVALMLRQLLEKPRFVGASPSICHRMSEALGRAEHYLETATHAPETPMYACIAAVLSDLLEPYRSDQVPNVGLLELASAAEGLLDKLFSPLGTATLSSLAILSEKQATQQSGFARSRARYHQALRKLLHANGLGGASRWLAEHGGLLSPTLPLEAGAMLEDNIREQQSPDGSWLLTSTVTALNLLALKARGHDQSDPAVARGVEFLRSLRQRQPDGTVQESWCAASLWDTLILQRVIDDVEPTDSQTRDEVISAVLAAQGRDGRWPFNLEGNTETEGDNDSSSVAVHTLCMYYPHLDNAQQSEAVRLAITNGTRALIAQQQKDRGWGAWEQDSLYGFGRRVPGTIETALNDGSATALTGRILISFVAAKATGILGAQDSRAVDEAIAGAISYLRDTQQDSGAWWSRWISGYISGFGFILQALRAAGVSTDDPMMVKARDFILSHQLSDGSWGEPAGVDKDPTLIGKGPGSPAQSAFAMMGLMMSSPDDDPAATRALAAGAEYLLGSEKNGEWTNSSKLYTNLAGFEYYDASAMTTAFVVYTFERYLSYLERGGEHTAQEVIFGPFAGQRPSLPKN